LLFLLFSILFVELLWLLDVDELICKIFFDDRADYLL
jgi:hypothetical protein